MKDLRQYQIDAVNNCGELVSKNKKSQLLILPTGTGKTRTFCSIIKALNAKTLVISHTSQLKTQIVEQCKKICPENFVLSQTIQWIMTGNNLDKIRELNFDLLIIDEAHHAASLSYQELIKIFKNDGKLVIGCTATPFRLDRKCIYKIFPSVMLQKNIMEMIEAGFLSDIKGWRIKTNIELKGIRIQRGDFNSKQLSSIINTENRNELICDAFKKLLSGKKSILFCTDIQHCESLSKTFNNNGLRCKSIHGNLTREEQRIRLQEFKHGKTNILTSCQLLTEGFDEPSIEAVMLCRPTKSPGLYIQMVGRGLRIHPGKDKCCVVDVTDNAHDICAFPTLISEGISTPQFKNFDSFDSIKDIKKAIDFVGNEVIIEEHEFVKTKEKTEMTVFQREYLVRNNIPFIEPLSYKMADIIIKNYTFRKANGLN